ncbi:hypothetical protein QE357_001004 [Siphonobacter sp. BAB-5404]|nr:hypothetical protein [Siphonobacter sp. SORGH_AS_1065]MDR6193952.1 hypothetical protein [Siphonobacter sp. SORGH_AS_0500]
MEISPQGFRKKILVPFLHRFNVKMAYLVDFLGVENNYREIL